MKLLLLSILLFFCGIGISAAQNEASSSVNLTNELKNLCKLSAEQTDKVQGIVSGFEKKRDETYRKYRHNLAELKKYVKQNRWDYEISLIGILNPSQMGLLKVFDQRNPDLMMHASNKVVDVSYFADDSETQPQSTTVAVSAPLEKTAPAAEPVTVIKTREQPAADTILTNAIRNYCGLSGEQFTKAAPILTDFEIKRDSLYKLYKDDKLTLSKEVRKNRLNYEVALVELLTPQQMRVLRAFNLNNKELMSGSGTLVHPIDYIPGGIVRISDDAHPIIKPIVYTPSEEVTNQEANSAKPDKNAGTEIVSLTDELKDLCNLTPEQIAKVDPIVSDFEKKRDETYKKYRTNPTMLKKLVKQNRWDYEVSLIGTLNPSQMGLLKVFDQRNPDLMTFNSSVVNDVSYFADSK